MKKRVKILDDCVILSLYNILYACNIICVHFFFYCRTFTVPCLCQIFFWIHMRRGVKGFHFVKYAFCELRYLTMVAGRETRLCYDYFFVRVLLPHKGSIISV